MIISMAIIICAFLFMSIITIIYFSKKRINNSETKLYNILIVQSLINMILEFWLCINILNEVKLYSFYNLLLNRTFLLGLFSWFTVFTIYLIAISFNKTIKKIKSLIFKSSPLILLVISMLLFLPIELVNNNGIAYSTGTSVNVLYITCFIYVVIWLISILINLKRIPVKKYIPFIVFNICFVIILLIRGYYPGLLLNSFSGVLATYLMYHTIENPDVKVLDELYKKPTRRNQTSYLK